MELLLLPKRLNTFLLTTKTLFQIKLKKKANWIICHFPCSCDKRVYKLYIRARARARTHTHTHTHIHIYISLCPTPGEGSTLDM